MRFGQDGASMPPPPPQIPSTPLFIQSGISDGGVQGFDWQDDEDGAFRKIRRTVHKLQMLTIIRKHMRITPSRRSIFGVLGAFLATE